MGGIWRNDWAAYDQAQVNEADWFSYLLRDLCNTIPPVKQASTGRPPLPISDMVYSIGLKVYSTLSTRRAMPAIREAKESGFLGRAPSYASAIRYMEKDALTPILRHLVQVSALPLRGVEVDFAQDSSGFSTSSYQRWFDHRWGTVKKEAQWVKVHLMTGVQTNIVTVADAAATMTADISYLPDFVRITAQHFRIREVSADKAYSSRKSLQAIAAVGGVPYIPFKSNASPVWKSGEQPHDPLWEKMFHLFTLSREEFNEHYHKRSNVETTFYMMKAKFGDRVRSKTPTAQVNEALMKVVCHNLCVLIKAIYTLGIAPAFSARGFASESPSDSKLMAS